MKSPGAVLKARDLGKTFLMHARGTRIEVFSGLSLEVAPGECVALAGHSGSGKSTLMRCLYGNYAPSTGTVELQHEASWIDIGKAEPRTVLHVRRLTLGYVSQFLRVIPRVPALDVVAEPLVVCGVSSPEAKDEAARWLTALGLPTTLWLLPPATFSGGEQQRVNVARGLIANRPILLLDEPTASLDAENRAIVTDLVLRARDAGTAIVGIFHDAEVRRVLATRTFDVEHHHGRKGLQA